MANKNFIDSNKKTKYGRHDVEFWIGTVVAYASQEEQINEGFGWMYKVRIDGDHSKNEDQVKDEQLSYAYCILPTTAGSGAAFKLRSARISQGDTVFGVRGGGVGAPAFIIGVFPRTRLTKNSSGNFGLLSGFYGSLVKNNTLTGEFNDQIGPGTPDVTILDPRTYNKSNRDDSSEKLNELGYDRNQDGIIDDAEKKLTPTRVAEDKNFDKGESITTQQLKYIMNNPVTDTKAARVEYESKVKDALDQAVTQNLVTREIANKMLSQVKKGKYGRALSLGFPPPVPFSR
tara:strand:+ start:1147 stop:2010 length:864 start_codon:yes stop_codon:yes gene_type:complete